MSLILAQESTMLTFKVFSMSHVLNDSAVVNDELHYWCSASVFVSYQMSKQKKLQLQVKIQISCEVSSSIVVLL